MSERRTNKRRQLLYYLKIFDEKSGDLLGQMADITTSGLNVICQKPVESGQSFTLKMSLPPELGSKGEIYFKAESLWCKPDVNPDFFSIGFRFIHISTRDVATIENLIEDFSFQD